MTIELLDTINLVEIGAYDDIPACLVERAMARWLAIAEKDKIDVYPRSSVKLRKVLPHNGLLACAVENVRCNHQLQKCWI